MAELSIGEEEVEPRESNEEIWEGGKPDGRLRKFLFLDCQMLHLHGAFLGTLCLG